MCPGVLWFEGSVQGGSVLGNLFTSPVSRAPFWCHSRGGAMEVRNGCYEVIRDPRPSVPWHQAHDRQPVVSRSKEEGETAQLLVKPHRVRHQKRFQQKLKFQFRIWRFLLFAGNPSTGIRRKIDKLELEAGRGPHEWVRHPTGADTPAEGLLTHVDGSSDEECLVFPNNGRHVVPRTDGKLPTLHAFALSLLQDWCQNVGFPTSGIPQRNRRCVTDHFGCVGRLFGVHDTAIAGSLPSLSKMTRRRFLAELCW